jgi:hypothetical protein
MLISIDIKTVPFGQLRMEIGKVIFPAKEYREMQAQEPIRYCEPQETASRIYEIQYENKLTNYVIPLSTA